MFIQKGVFIICCLGLLSSCGQLERILKTPRNRDAARNTDHAKILVLGDSISTGALTHPDINIDLSEIAERLSSGDNYRAEGSFLSNPALFHVAGDDQVIESPGRLTSSLEDFEGSDIFAKSGEVVDQDLLDIIEVPSFSWSNLLGLGRGVQSSDITIAAQNGAQVAAGKKQLDNFLEASGGKLPPLVFVFFTGNDLCRERDKATNFTSPDDYEHDLRTIVDTILGKGKPAAEGTKIVILKHLNILQLVEDKELLANKTIKVNDGQSDRELSCRDYLRDYEEITKSSSRGGFAKLADDLEKQMNEFRYHPMNFCYNVLSHSAAEQDGAAEGSLEDLRKTLDAYRDRQAMVAREYAEKISRDRLAGFSVEFIESTADLSFTPDDLANDCFHLSVHGQEKIASAVLGDLDGAEAN